MERLTYRGSERMTEDGLIRPSYSDYPTRRIIERLAEYEDLEEQGLLLRLPCKVGDTVYSLDRFCGGSSDCPSRPCKECPDHQLEIYERKFALKDIPEFGKTIFLTKEEAEQKLNEMESDWWKKQIEYSMSYFVLLQL